MRRWLCIEASLLGSRYHGLRRDGREAEWPPSPHRVFQALVATALSGARGQERKEEKQAAFRWLEQREPPEIAAPRAQVLLSRTLSVPNNDMDVIARDWSKGKEPSKQPSELRTLKTFRPQAVDGDATVRYLWPLSTTDWESARAHVELLCEEARHLHHLGLGIDLVAGNGRVLDDSQKRSLPNEVWLADSAGQLARVPKAGSFDELLERHQAFRRRLGGGHVDPPMPPSRVGRVTYRRRAEGRLRPAHAFELLKDGALASFDSRKAAIVAAWVRHAANDAARRLTLDEGFVNGFVCGHGENDAAKSHRLSYVPLPSIGHPNVDGRIRRLLLVEPFGDSDERAERLARALSRASLVGQGGEIMADLCPEPEAHASEVFKGYLARADTWGSVTPVVLPGLDDRASRKAVGLVAKSLGHAGYTTPVAEIDIQREPVFPGAMRASDYFTPKHLDQRPRVHVVIRFAEKVAGPVVIGAGRHCGLGVFAAL